MSTLTVQIPESLKKRIEELAAKEGFSVGQFLASAAGEKLAVMLTMDYLRQEAAAGRISRNISMPCRMFRLNLEMNGDAARYLLHTIFTPLNHCAASHSSTFSL